jgi:hypothetical protein
MIVSKLHSMHTWRIRNNCGKFCFDWSIIKCTLRDEQITFSAVSCFSWEGFFLKPHTSQQTCMRCNRSNFLCDPSIIKNILLQEQSAFGVYLSFRRKDGYELHTSHSSRLSYRRNIVCDLSIIRAVKMENKNPFATASCLPLEGFS